MHIAKKPQRRAAPAKRIVLAVLALGAGMLAAIWLDFASTDEPDQPRQPTASPALPPKADKGPTLADLVGGDINIVDLAWPLNSQSAYWPGDNYKPFELHTIANLEKDGVLSKAFSSPEHLGTHLDAPNHFEPQRPSVDQIPPGHLFSPAVVIDVAGPASADSDYMLSLDDVRRFESEHGRIPDHAVVLANTGWGKFWSNQTRYANRDVMGKLHFPGFSSEAVDFLIKRRHIRGIGLDTMSVDPGVSRDFPVHHLLGKAECYGLENLANLDKLPPRDFDLVVAPMKIETGSGAPTRVFALVPKDADEN